MYSFYFGNNYEGMKFTYGGYNESLVKSGASFVSTQIANSSDQNWNFKIKAVLYEGEDIYDDYFKYGILDTGATFMTVPNKVMNTLIGKIIGVYG